MWTNEENTVCAEGVKRILAANCLLSHVADEQTRPSMTHCVTNTSMVLLCNDLLFFILRIRSTWRSVAFDSMCRSTSTRTGWPCGSSHLR
jgi:hypothetical protein